MESEKSKVVLSCSKKQGTFESKWPDLQKTILKLLRNGHLRATERQNLDWSISYHCLSEEEAPRIIFKALKLAVLKYIEQAELEISAHQDDNEAFLWAYNNAWLKFSIRCTDFPKPFICVETELIKKCEPNLNIKRKDGSILRKYMHDTWMRIVFSKHCCTLLFKALYLVNAERSGRVPESQLPRITFHSIAVTRLELEGQLGSYLEHLKIAYVSYMAVFYTPRRAIYLKEHGVRKYMRYAMEKQKEEENRSHKCLGFCTDNCVEIVKECTVEVLVAGVKDIILEKCPEMIRNNETEELQLMYELMNMMPNGVDPMARHLKEHVIKKMLEEISSSKDVIVQDSGKYIELLDQYYNIFTTLVKETFDDDHRFRTSTNQAFQQLINDTSEICFELPSGLMAMTNDIASESRCPYLLAVYCDMLLKTTPVSKKLTSDEIDEKLEHVLLMLKYVQNKYVFVNYYKSHLTRRLIFDTSAHLEKEEAMVERLRDVGMPEVSVRELNRMLEDMKLNESFIGEFRNIHCNSNEIPDFNVKILNGSVWKRSSEEVPAVLPVELEKFASKVEKFYQRKHTHRKLQCCHKLSTGTITFSTSVGNFDLDVTPFQLAVLFTWNERNTGKVSFEELRLTTEIPDEELRETLWSLVAIQRLKRQPLLFEPEVKSPKDFKDCTLFWVNDDFAIVRNGKLLKQGRLDLIGKFQLPAAGGR